MIYSVIDFLKSRLGQMLVLSAVVIVVIIGVGAYHQKKQQETLAMGAFPRASEHPSYDRGKTMRVDGKDVYGHVESNASFEPFEPPSEMEVEPEPQFVLPMTNLDPQPRVERDRFEPMPSLIASERSAPELSDLPVSQVKDPGLKIVEGALLHCQLTAPVSSNQGRAQVQAKLTKPYYVRGRMLLPIGTQLQGKLQNGKGDRMYFTEEWQAKLPSGKWTSLNGQVQEKALHAKTSKYLPGDGLAGLPGAEAEITKSPNQQWRSLLSTFGSAATRVAQNRTRTVIGDQIPASAQNVLLEGTGDLIENWSSQLSERQSSQLTLEPNPLVIDAGIEFYIQLVDLQ